MKTPMVKIQSYNFSSSQVRVAFRVFPFLPQEIEKDWSKPALCVSLLDQKGKEVTVHLKDQTTSLMIPRIFHGHNAMVIAYGATGSGKMYTV
ncbi:hypothetical protein IEQ34_015757 [Dendrobium chrysotoxum]|uniref:Kinesin motor domain-containing protein n=1 Tax=Dendrobium chrysotoxum TaxID=161865 RepID=A0AAV7GHJ8_DENCH|nr:hypothetical protein IEQ34_015757 [Dendrobium chrysotoxum]